MSLLANLNTGPSQPFRDIGHLLMCSPTIFSNTDRCGELHAALAARIPTAYAKVFPAA